jgi:hypothetical protein
VKRTLGAVESSVEDETAKVVDHRGAAFVSDIFNFGVPDDLGGEFCSTTLADFKMAGLTKRQ